MKDILVKEAMISIANYVTVKKEDHLVEVLHAIERKRQSEGGHAHRDAIVVDEKGQFVGKVTMIDIFRALEPNYKDVHHESAGGTLTQSFVSEAVKDFKLWLEPAKTICQRGASVAVADIMHTPDKSEYLEESSL
jgi:Mg2+/Co2+ transporter CorC